ncbi:hypothetical protein MVEN_01098800 [Mycena venus]|uniref:Peptidase C14 caspase domain-containing protein n=1 Tax=Mycena venus TaxID=2733690 RepID=A0A8H7CXF5_9AGAR|nr:hypothetical protein MVEN_01098800 [Mycena venus]
MTRAFAFVVAIDQYSSPEINNLRKCIDDADLIQSYLRKRFKEAHIHSLYNESASREAILAGFRSHLIENNKIEYGDPIIFYFAGHGCRVKAPDKWRTTDGRIETICPYDELTLVQGTVVPGIPDLTIAALLRELGREKGNNITVIFDSCHSGGAARQHVNIFRSRSEYPACDLIPFPDIDKGIWIADAGSYSSAGTLRARGLGRSDSSYVLLAACEENEVAQDGYFTELLVNSLQNQQLRPNTTYADVLASLPITSRAGQHPQCGWNSDRVLFTTTAVCAHDEFTVKKDADGKYQINAWGIHGVRDGMRFTVLDPRAFLLVETVRQFSSILVPVLQTQNLPVEIPDGSKAVLNIQLKAFLHAPLSIPSDASCGVTITTLLEEAQIVISGFLDQDGKERLRVESRDALLTSLSCHVTDVAWNKVGHSLPRFLDAIAHFRYHLGRHSDNDGLYTDSDMSKHTVDAITQGFTVGMFRLGPVISFRFREPAIPETNIFSDRVAKLFSDKDARYGIQLRNTTGRHLFFYLFYFDPSDYSVEAWYLPDHRHFNTVATAHETVTVGYGAGGGSPIRFELDENKMSDSGFLKVFASAEYIDMRSLEQPAAVERAQRLKSGRTPDILDQWGAWLGAITLFRVGGP